MIFFINERLSAIEEFQRFNFLKEKFVSDIKPYLLLPEPSEVFLQSQELLCFYPIVEQTPVLTSFSSKMLLKEMITAFSSLNELEEDVKSKAAG